MRLPNLMHVTHAETLVSFEDSTGKVLEEITTLGGAADTLMHASGAAVVSGLWKDGVLDVEREAGRGGKTTQTFAVEDAGNTLVIHTRVQFGDGPARDFKRVYRKVTDS